MANISRKTDSLIMRKLNDKLYYHCNKYDGQFERSEINVNN